MVLRLTRPGIEPEFTVLVADALSIISGQVYRAFATETMASGLILHQVKPKTKKLLFAASMHRKSRKFGF